MSNSMTISRFVLLLAVALSACFPWLTGCASPQSETSQVASRIREAVTRADKTQFEDFFSDTSDLSEDDLTYYFGNERPSDLRKFMIKASVKSRSFDGVNDEGRRTVTIVYYDSISVKEPVMLDWKLIGDGWLKKYAAVDLVLVDGKWCFDSTPFFFFRHAPWAGDYG